MTYSKLFLLILSLIPCLLTQTSNNIPFPQSVIRHMATRQMRYHHYLWHQIRDNWNRFSESTRREFRRIGWEPTNPSRDSSGRVINTNYAGEDFLYMHRTMIATANRIISQNRERYGRIRGWTTIPRPGDREYPVPPPYQRGSDRAHLASYKTDDYFRRLQQAEETYKDPARLRRMSLNELGLRIETGVHNDMHMRWANFSSVGYRSGGSTSNGVPTINRMWDDPRYDWLVDSYSSHVNPIFWKIHGWIDDRIEDWRRANGLSSIRWRGTWTGGPVSSLGSVARKHVATIGAEEDDSEEVGDLIEEGLEIFLKSGIPESSFADKVKWPIKARKTQKKSRSCKRVIRNRKSN